MARPKGIGGKRQKAKSVTVAAVTVDEDERHAELITTTAAVDESHAESSTAPAGATTLPLPLKIMPFSRKSQNQ